ncbi:hypothetical protein [Shewanella nanhaiensis]|uniref:Uncharacterized protein n=1 Tax=Shewanella nanhaiensis TaxID=2864872 RepID=A0ABS7E0S7_9GAMM|nr:hypothetical protein [Shewanella nanhaiensis]MBW8183309.1 hypothetical protein [Shewanella nanhaiensis]
MDKTGLTGLGLVTLVGITALGYQVFTQEPSASLTQSQSSEQPSEMLAHLSDSAREQVELVMVSTQVAPEEGFTSSPALPAESISPSTVNASVERAVSLPERERENEAQTPPPQAADLIVETDPGPSAGKDLSRPQRPTVQAKVVAPVSRPAPVSVN